MLNKSVTNKCMHNFGEMITLLFIFPNFYIINLPTIFAIQFLDGVGESIVKLYKPVYRIILVYTVSQFSHKHHLKIV